MILITGLIGIDTTDILSRTAISLLTGVLFLIVIVISKGVGFGGGDIKLSVASVFLLGAKQGISGLFVGMRILRCCNY